MRFDYIIQNPPYKRGLHFKFFERSLGLLSNIGQMIIIEPSTWLINVKTTGSAKKYNMMKDRLAKHVKNVHIENYNHEFNIGLYMPCAITHIDKAHTYDKIYFNCCGEEKYVDSLYDCNLIGPYKLVRSILDKCQAYGDTMEKHIYDANKDER